MSVGGATLAPPIPVDVPVTEARPRLPRRTALAGTGLVLTLAGLLLAAPVLVLCGIVLGVVSLLMRWVPLDVALPLAATACVAGSALAGVAAHSVGVDLFAAPAAVGGALVLAGVLAVLDSRRGLVSTDAPGTPSRALWIAYAPALVAFAIAALQASSVRAAASWTFFGTDITRHLALVKQIRETGALDYAANAYPGAFHTLLALVSTPGAPRTGPADLLAYDLRLVAAATWLTLAVLMSTASTLVLRLGQLLGSSRAVTVCAAAIGPAMLLVVNSFAVTFIYLGAAPSMLAVVALWSIPLVALELERTGVRRVLPLLVLACLVTATVAHMWQALVIVPPAGLLAIVVGRRRGSSGRPLVPGRRTALVVVGVAVLTAAVALPAILGVLRAGGIAIAAIPGAAPGPPIAVLILCVVAVGWSLRARRHDAVRALLGMALALLAMAALLLYGSGRLDVTQYYVLKALWFFALLLLPLVALWSMTAVARVQQMLWRQIGRLGPWARVAQIAVVAVAMALFGAFVLPIPAVSGVLALNTARDLQGSSESAREYDIAIDYGTKFLPAITVPVEVGSGIFPDPFLTKVTSSIIGVETGQPENPGPTFAVCAAVRAVAGSHAAVVVTTLDPAVLLPYMEADGCADVPVVRIEGPRRTLQGVPPPRSSAYVRG